jgi:hypothetical protein
MEIDSNNLERESREKPDPLLYPTLNDGTAHDRHRRAPFDGANGLVDLLPNIFTHALKKLPRRCPPWCTQASNCASKQPRLLMIR